MAKVKVLIEPGEDQTDVDNALLKALQYHSSGDAHLDEAFDDPAMVHLAQHLENVHMGIYSEMIKEIIDELDKEYSDGNF